MVKEREMKKTEIDEYKKALPKPINKSFKIYPLKILRNNKNKKTIIMKYEKLCLLGKVLKGNLKLLKKI